MVETKINLYSEGFEMLNNEILKLNLTNELIIINNISHNNYGSFLYSFIIKSIFIFLDD